MRSFLRIVLLVVGCVAVTRAAAALTVTPNQDFRILSAEACGVAGGYCFEDRRTPGSGFPAFDAEVGTSALPGAAFVREHSSLDGLGMQGWGTVDLTLVTPGFTANGSSTFGIRFTIDQAAAYSFVGDLQLAVTPPPSPSSAFSARVSASLTSTSTTYLNESIVSSSPVFEEGVRHIAQNGVLPAGTYSLNVTATGNQGGPQQNFASMSYVFGFGLTTVPEPSELAYVALMALALGFAAAFRSTPR